MSTAIRDAQPGDAPDFSRLVPLSGPSFLPALFGPETEDILAALFLDKRNLFSYEFTRVAVAGGRRAGMLLGCTGRQRNRVALHTGRLLLQRSGNRWPSTLWNLIRAEMLLTSPRETDFYITSIAVYPEFRGRGIATALLLDAEKRALDAECRRLVLGDRKPPGPEPLQEAGLQGNPPVLGQNTGNRVQLPQHDKDTRGPAGPARGIRDMMKRDTEPACRARTR